MGSHLLPFGVHSTNSPRFRAQEYQTDRDPNGPLTALGQVFYRLIVNASRGVGGFMWDAAHLFPENDSKRRRLTSQETYSRAVEHFLLGLRPQQDDGALPSEASPYGSHGHGNRKPKRRGHAPEQEVNPAGQASAAFAKKKGALRGSELNRASHKREAAENGTAKSMIAKTSYATSRLSKKTAKAIVSPLADLTVSLSKGFHNAPKYYHDTTVRKLPRVVGVKSGFEAAGNVSIFFVLPVSRKVSTDQS